MMLAALRQVVGRITPNLNLGVRRTRRQVCSTRLPTDICRSGSTRNSLLSPGLLGSPFSRALVNFSSFHGCRCRLSSAASLGDAYDCPYLWSMLRRSPERAHVEGDQDLQPRHRHRRHACHPDHVRYPQHERIGRCAVCPISVGACESSRGCAIRERRM